MFNLTLLAKLCYNVLCLAHPQAGELDGVRRQGSHDERKKDELLGANFAMDEASGETIMVLLRW
jgi:hypothetical protein